MLCNLDIKNIAVIENLSFEPCDELSVLTGETGAGKSVIIDSVNLILGERINKNLVRYGEEKARISAMFTLNEKIRAKLNEAGIDTEDDTFVITREITKDGKSVARINSVMVNASFLRELSGMLIDIHGQHDNQALLNPSKHIDFLDRYAENTQLLGEYLKLYQQLKNLTNEYKKLSMDEQERLSKIDLLKYQTEELLDAGLKIGEKELLQEESILISNSEKITKNVMSAYSKLINCEKCAFDVMQEALSQLESVCEFDSELKNHYEKLSDAVYTVEDVGHELRNYFEKIEYDEERLDEVSQRLDLIRKLEKKYGGSIEASIEYLEKAQKELETLENSSQMRDDILKQIEITEKEANKYSEELSKRRKEAALRLSKEIEKELTELDMPKATFEVSVECADKLFEKGTDKIEFLFSANPGQPKKPLVQIASGGELSRTMLALKTVLVNADEVDTLIFDEIDTGVSGSAAQKIAKKLADLGKTKQVICISHLPQIAAGANSQYKITKTVEDEKTSTVISLLSYEQRVNELAKMIDGELITETSLNHARQILERGY